MSKLERQSTVNFRRKTLEQHDVIIIQNLPDDHVTYSSAELSQIKQAIDANSEFAVIEGDGEGAVIELPEIGDYTWLPIHCVVRVR